MIQVSPEPLKDSNSNKTLSYMLFFLGIVLFIVGIYLATYSTVVMVNESTYIMGQIFNLPTVKQIQPYLSIGVIMLLFAIALIAVAFSQNFRE